MSNVLNTIIKLNRLTKEDTVKWNISKIEPSSISGTEELNGLVYTATVLGRNFRLYKYLYRYYYDEDSYNWLEGYRLEFIDSNGNSEWAFPENDQTVEDLYDSVRFKTSKVDEFMDDFLDDLDDLL